METHETITAVQEMKVTLKEILNVLKDIKDDFKQVTYSGDTLVTTPLVDEEVIKAVKLAKKVKENVETN